MKFLDILIGAGLTAFFYAELQKAKKVAYTNDLSIIDLIADNQRLHDRQQYDTALAMRALSDRLSNVESLLFISDKDIPHV
jgi:hypothetical protein